MTPTPPRRLQVLAAGALAALCLLGTARAMRPAAPPRTLDITPAQQAETHRVHHATRATLPALTPHAPLLLVRQDCPACHALVRTLVRRARRQAPAHPLAVAVDHPWPDLLTLAQSGAAIVHLAPAVRLLPFTPTLAFHAPGDSLPPLRIGVPTILGALDTLQAFTILP
jgi:hypothetical protein